MVNYIAIAIPVFFALMGVEYLVARWQGRRLYRFNDAVTDLGCGIGQQVTGLFLKAVLFAGYIQVYEGFALFELPAGSPWTWLLAVIGIDFLYYWWHRLSHVVNFMWAAHIVHHQSEDMNFAVALRQAWFTSATAWIFYIPLALLGVPPLVFIAADAFSTLYQFWIHTETIGKLGPLENVLNTPSHHRVHHAINPHYIDKNYGAVLIVWDRLFNSFQIENVRPVYGILKPFGSWNPVWANFHYWVEIARKARAAPGWGRKIAVWFAPPGWDPATGSSSPAPPVERASYRKFDIEIPAGLRAYIAAQFVPIAAATFALLMWQEALGEGLALAGALAILLTLLTWGGLFELRPWALPVEVGRIALIGAGLALLGAQGHLSWAWALGLLAPALVFLVWIMRYRGAFAARSATPPSPA